MANSRPRRCIPISHESKRDFFFSQYISAKTSSVRNDNKSTINKKIAKRTKIKIRKGARYYYHTAVWYLKAAKTTFEFSVDVAKQFRDYDGETGDDPEMS